MLANKCFTLYTKEAKPRTEIIFPNDTDSNNLEWLFLKLKECALIHREALRSQINLCLISHNRTTKITVINDENLSVGYVLTERRAV